MTRIAAPQLSFADLELRSQGVHLDPLLQGILTFLDDHAPLVEQVRQDLARGLKNGRERFEVLVGAAVLANNLLRIADLLRHRKPARHAQAA